jgi:hypothetical protein
VSNIGSPFFQLYIGKPGDFFLSKAKATKVPACKVTWRTDSKELVVIHADEVCSQEVGSVVRLPVNNPQDQTELAPRGDNPTFQPLPIPQG